MKHFYSRLWFLFAVLLAVSGHGITIASVPSVPGYLYGAQSFVTGNYFPATSPSVSAACAVAAGQVASGYGVNSVVPSGETCVYNYNGGSWAGGITKVYGSVCPAGSSLVGSSCSCNSPLIENSASSACISAPVIDPVKVLNDGGGQIKYDATYPSDKVCFSGRVVIPHTSGCTLDGHCVAGGPFVDAGSSCGPTSSTGGSTATTPNTDPPLGIPSNCASGLIPGQVNGVGVCIKPSIGNTVKSETTSGTSTTANPDGSPGISTSGADKKITTETSCSGDTCTTKTTTSVRDGSGTVVVQKETKIDNKDDFCSLNKSAPVCSESQAVDTAMPTAPKLYEPSFPRGIAGVWSDRKAQLTSAPLSGLISNLMPSVGSGGSCPAMMINLNITSWAMFGIRDVAPPCYIWDFGKVVIILSALLLARSLIFGG